MNRKPLSDEERKERRRQASKRYYQRIKERDAEKRKACHRKWYDKVKDTAEHRQKTRAAARANNRRKSGAIDDACPDQPSGQCEICSRYVDKLYFDHDHKSGKFRGWLCPSCNTGLGLFKDSQELMVLAINYLKIHST